MVRAAALDLGSNSFLCLIADVEGEKIIRVVIDQEKIVRLAEGVHAHRKFAPAALARAEQCLAQFSALAAKHGAEKILAVSTSAARDVKNAQDFLDIGKKHGIPIQVISGENEAALTFRGATAGSSGESCAVIDVGGGSTEIIIGQGNSSTGHSFDLGCVRLFEMFSDGEMISRSALARMEQFVDSTFLQSSKLAGLITKDLIAVAGTPTTLAALDFAKHNGRPPAREQIEGYILSRAALGEWLEVLVTTNLNERKKIPGMVAERADILFVGVALLLRAFNFLRVERCRVSNRGVRYGLAAEAESWD